MLMIRKLSRENFKDLDFSKFYKAAGKLLLINFEDALFFLKKTYIIFI